MTSSTRSYEHPCKYAYNSGHIILIRLYGFHHTGLHTMSATNSGGSACRGHFFWEMFVNFVQNLDKKITKNSLKNPLNDECLNILKQKSNNHSKNNWVDFIQFILSDVNVSSYHLPEPQVFNSFFIRLAPVELVSRIILW